MRIQLRLQWKMALFIAFILIGTVSVLIWKTREIMIKDKLDFLADSSMKQIAPLKRLVQDHLEERKARMVKFASTHTSTASKSRPFGDFDVIALVQPQTSEGENKSAQWLPSWVESNATATTKGAPWPEGFSTTLLKSLPYGKVRDGETVFTRVSDQAGLPVYAIMVSVEIQNTPAAGLAAASTLPDSTDYAAATAGSGKKAVIVGFAANDPLADVTEEYIGSTSTVFLVDDKGYVASHVNKAYLGALFSEDPIVHEILTTKKTSATGNYEDLESRPVQGHFVRVDHTNLYAVITTPLQAVSDAAASYTRTAIMIGGAASVIGMLLAYIFGRSISDPLLESADAIRAINRGEPHVFKSSMRKDEIGQLMRLLSESSPVALASKLAWVQQPSTMTADEPDTGSTSVSKLNAVQAAAERSNEARLSAYQSFNEGFSGALKAPLMAILGHAQLAKAKTGEDQVRAHSESIEREARRAKEILEQLQTWSNETKLAKIDEKVRLQQVIEGAIALREDTLAERSVELVTELHAVPLVNGSAEQLQSAILNLIDNAVEALNSRPKKQLKIQLDFMREHIYLVITDTGIGMSRDVKDRAFEPFFKAFESPDRIGLGLSLVQTAVKLTGGTCHIDSTPGEGATITLKIPVSEEQKQAFQKGEDAKLAESMSLKFNPQKPSAVAEPDQELGRFVSQSFDSRIDIAIDLGAIDLGGDLGADTPVDHVVNQPLKTEELKTSPLQSDDDDDDDDDEQFASVSLKSGVSKSSAPPTPSKSESLLASDDDASDLPNVDPKKLQPNADFRVTIRRPRARS